jgi:hypothetical protein
MQFKTNIGTSKQVFDPSSGQSALRAAPALQFGSPAASELAQDVYRGQGQAAAVNLGRASAQAQNQYYLAAQRAQDQSVLGGLSNLSQQQANRVSEAQQAEQTRYRALNDLLSGAFGAIGALK